MKENNITNVPNKNNPNLIVLKKIKHLLSEIEEENQGPPSALQSSLKAPKLLMSRNHRPAITVERLSQPKVIH